MSFTLSNRLMSKLFCSNAANCLSVRNVLFDFSFFPLKAQKGVLFQKAADHRKPNHFPNPLNMFERGVVAAFPNRLGVEIELGKEGHIQVSEGNVRPVAFLF